MRHFALIGHPLDHSFSASYFNDKFATEGIDAEYYNIDIPDIAELPEIIRKDKDLCGLNVTIPYKKAVMPLLTEMTERARAIGAVNTIKIARRGDKIELIGDNTDAPAFQQTLKPFLKPYHKQALLLGATGGAAQAVNYALKELGICVVPVSRSTMEGAIAYDQIDSDLMAQSLIVVNATPLGMYPKIETAPEIPYGVIGKKHLCYDLVYNPEETLFLKQAKQKGATIRNGLAMLYRQAELAWEFWNR